MHPVARSSWTGNPIVYPEDAPEVEASPQGGRGSGEHGRRQARRAKPPSVTVRAVNGLAAQELIDASADADLVVVSSRGGGGFPGLKMGSVSSQVASHAECPVVVIR